MTTKLPPDLLTVRQFAERVGISVTTALKEINAGEVPEAVQFGKQWRISSPRLERRLHGDHHSPTATDDSLSRGGDST